jgi:hypothetical protein
LTEPRLYHAVAILLPDARVLVMGGEDYGTDPNTQQGYEQRHSGEIYSPPYLFKGPRPWVTGAPTTSIPYASPATPTFTVGVNIPMPAGQQPPYPHPTEHLRVVLMRPGSASHHFDFDQKFIELQIESATFLRSGGLGAFFDLAVRAPDNATFAVQGYYMLFVLLKGVPSMSVVVKIG